MSLSPCRRQRARYRRLQRHDLRGDTRGDSHPSRGLHQQMEAEASCRGRQPGSGWRTLVHLHSPTAEPMARVRTTNAIERLHEEFKRRSRRKPCCHPPTPPRCFSERCWHGQINMAKSMSGCDKYLLPWVMYRTVRDRRDRSVQPLFVLCGLVFRSWKSIICWSAPRFILASSAIVPQILLNVPLSTVLLTHGLGLLFLLWYITPRGIFEPNTIERTHNVAWMNGAQHMSDNKLTGKRLRKLT